MDAAQAKLLADSLQGKAVGGWAINGRSGNGKSAVVLSGSKDGVTAAVKVFHPELVERYGKPVQLERIAREKSLIGAEHPNLVRILDGGECSATGHLFIVMEWLPYTPLSDALQLIPLQVVPHIIAQVASAARFLEDRSLAHRDIKPENVMVSSDFSRAVLMDLGVLRPIGISNLTDVDQRSFIGTLRYSSPEFLLRQEKDTVEGWRAVTFYQLGATLHDMLMKRPLFDDYSEPFSQLVDAVRHVIPKIYSDNARCVALANHCLVKNPATRLELVAWTDFSESNSAVASSATAARDRIKLRQKYFKQGSRGQSTSLVDAQRLVRAALDELCNRFESRIAALMNDMQCFPLRATRSEKFVADRRCKTCVHFERDDEKGLSHRITMSFEITLLDENQGSPICRAACCAVFSNAGVSSEELKPSRHFFTGEVQALLDGVELERQFLDALEEAYRLQDTGSVPMGDVTLPLIN